MLVSVHPTDILLVQDWKMVKRIKDPNTHNKEKDWLALIPGFDENDFPFVITSGFETFNIVNIKE